MKHRLELLWLTAGVALSMGSAHAQNINVDFGPAGGAVGAPSNAYPAIGQPGVWQVVDQPVTNGLLDVNGQPTAANLTIAASQIFPYDCDHPQTSGDEQAMLDDRLALWAEAWVEVTGLEPAFYEVYLYGLDAGDWPDCLQFCSPWMTVCNGTDCGSPCGDGPHCQDLTGEWTGQLRLGETFTAHTFDLTGGGDLNLWLGDVDLGCYMQVSGLQIVKLEATNRFCFGDGSGTPCPCGNTGPTGTGCANSSGLGGWIEASGSTSVSVDDLRFTAHELLPGQAALLFVGLSQLGGGGGIPLGDGLRCAGNGVIRLGITTPNPNGLAYWDDLGALGGWGAGDERQFQVWYRDPSGSPCLSAFNLTQAIQAFFVP